MKLLLNDKEYEVRQLSEFGSYRLVETVDGERIFPRQLYGTNIMDTRDYVAAHLLVDDNEELPLPEYDAAEYDAEMAWLLSDDASDMRDFEDQRRPQ